MPVNKGLIPFTPAIFKRESHDIFPEITCLLTPPFTKGTAGTVKKLLKETPPKCLVLCTVTEESGEDPKKFAGMREVGVVCDISYSKKGFLLEGDFRARVIKTVFDKKTQLWRAEIEQLDDEPPVDSGDLDESMLFGCVQAIDDLARRLIDTIVSSNGREDLELRIESIQEKIDIRNRKAAYLLPWVAMAYMDYIDGEKRYSVLKENNIIERLQKVIEILENEIDIFEHTESLKAKPDDIIKDDSEKKN